MSLELIRADCSSTKLFKVHSFITERFHLKFIIKTVSIKYFRNNIQIDRTKEENITTIHFALKAMFVSRETAKSKTNECLRQAQDSTASNMESGRNHFLFPSCAAFKGTKLTVHVSNSSPITQGLPSIVSCKN